MEVEDANDRPYFDSEDLLVLAVDENLADASVGSLTAHDVDEYASSFSGDERIPSKVRVTLLGEVAVRRGRGRCIPRGELDHEGLRRAVDLRALRAGCRDGEFVASGEFRLSLRFERTNVDVHGSDYAALADSCATAPSNASANRSADALADSCTTARLPFNASAAALEFPRGPRLD